MEGMLQGLKVVDLSSVLAGPLTGTFLAECGAHVLKVEPPTGDVTQTWRVAGEPSDRMSAYYAAANAGKETVFLDLKSEEGKDHLHQELQAADVLIQNMKWNDLDIMGLMPHDLKAKYPKLIHVRLVGSEFDSQRLAYDVVVQAETGFMSMTGHPDRPPARMPVALMDVLASHHMRTAVFAGLFHREKTGDGWYAEVSLLGAGLTALVNQGTNALINQHVPQRQGSLHPNIAPYGDLLECLDGDIVLAVGSNSQFAQLCSTLGCQKLSLDSHFKNNVDRLSHRSELMRQLNAAANKWRRQDLLKALHQNRVPAGAIFNVHEALSQEGIKERYVIQEQGLSRLRTSAIAPGGFPSNLSTES